MIYAMLFGAVLVLLLLVATMFLVYATTLAAGKELLKDQFDELRSLLRDQRRDMRDMHHSLTNFAHAVRDLAKGKKLTLEFLDDYRLRLRKDKSEDEDGST